jgi:RNA binding exosome subunit
MEEENNPDEAHLDNYTQKKIKDGIDNLLQEKDLKIKWRKELENNPAVVEYFKGYFGNPMKSFLDSYLNTKHLSYSYGDMYKNMLERKRDQWINEAHKQLEYILQKQLFDKQCLWRAQQITIEGVTVVYDFKVWEQDILNCPFLEVITEYDIELYQAFLYDIDFPPHYLDHNDWQDHEEIKACYTSNEEEDDFAMPDWYEYHNNKTGNSSLLLLPDTIGKKENFYIEIYRQAKNAKHAETKLEPEPEWDKRPYLSTWDDKTIKFFVDTFEDKETQKKYKYYSEGSKNHANFDLQHTLNCILDADEPIPVESHYDIRLAIEIAYNKYYFKKVTAHLPLAHEQYLFNKKMGFKFEKEKENRYIEFRDNFKRMILEGRALNGEEQNFDY